MHKSVSFSFTVVHVVCLKLVLLTYIVEEGSQAAIRRSDRERLIRRRVDPQTW